MSGLFDRKPVRAPLADRMRPTTLDEVVGQERALGPGSILRRLVQAKHPPSLILWGPPGVGKTTIARIIAASTGLRMETLSAVSSGVKELREVVARAKDEQKLGGKGTVLFVDEVHRWSKSQQDALLPHVEDGTLVFLGATTENPSFEVVAPLLSRSRVVILEPLSLEALVAIARRALADSERGLAGAVDIDEPALELVARLAAGDARSALNILDAAAAAAQESAVQGARPRIDEALVREAAQRSAPLYDKAGEAHYDAASALIKSLRGSDPDAALYWMARMIEGGEDPVFVAWRLVIFASEDVGLADPFALSRAVAAAEAVRFIGLPEATLVLSQATIDLALAPKSNAAKEAWLAVREDVHDLERPPPPLHLRNAPTPLLKKIGYGEGYLYPHDFPGAVVDQEYLPEQVRKTSQRMPYYRPTEREEPFAKRLQSIAAARAEQRKRAGGSP